MPIYEYICDDCDIITEKLQGINDNPLTTCDDCGGKVKRIISQSAFHLKGTGWFKTDYPSNTDDNKKKSKAEGEKPAECAKCPNSSPACTN